ncbi:hypothetical protein BH20ACT13_BH20ACT13_03210 [soil metagenome]
MAQASTPEEQLETLLVARRQALEEQVARLRETVADLERRESLLRDSRASVERVRRVGAADLDLREAELASSLRDATVREERLRSAEIELARRRSELGAVELKREAIDQRERAVADREDRIATREEELADRERSLGSVVELAFVPGGAYRLSEIEPAPLSPGSAIAVEGAEYLVARLGPSPLPADTRRCAYLVESHGRGEAEA